MSTYEIYQVILSITLAFIFGCYALISGWLMFKNPKTHIPFQNHLKAKIFKVPKESLIDSNRKHGIARVVVGALLLLGAILQVIGLILL